MPEILQLDAVASSSDSEEQKKSIELTFPVVGIGASAGGVEALTNLFRSLPMDSGLAFVVVQHLDPNHESILPELLARVSNMPVQQIQDGMKAEKNHVYVVPPNACVCIEAESLNLVPREKIPHSHMPIDHFFRSLAERQGAIGIILSGTGSDGALGLQKIKANGGITFVQNEESAKFFGMPQSAISTGAVDFILPVERIAQELVRITAHPYVVQSAGAFNEQDASESSPPLDAEQLDQVLKLLRTTLGTDFTYYKPSTIQRRLVRRMALQKIDGLKEYVSYLRQSPDELKSLYYDLLIKVTSFFRDAKTFEELKQSVIPRLLEQHPAGTPIRIWIPGCATGEEVYSIIICFMECLAEKSAHTQLKVFATDIDEATLKTARAGIYLENIESEVSQERLERFFSKVDHRYTINKSIRDMCTFAKHDLGKDPPFSNLDLISCRNVLIYFRPTLQKRIIPIFHYALKPTGFLTLGTSETIGTFSTLFEPVDKKHKIYTKKWVAARALVDFIPREKRTGETSEDPPAQATFDPLQKEVDMFKEADRVLLNHYAPAGILLNEQMEIIQFRGDTTPYLVPSPGKASFNLLKMARKGLLVEIKSAIEDARKTDTSASRESIAFSHDNISRNVTLTVIPLKFLSAYHFVVLFEESRSKPSHSFEFRSFLKKLFQFAKGRRADSAKLKKQEMESKELHQMGQELDTTKQYLQSIIENQDTTNEELKSANEEILSSNEELQSTNEELETSQEELQSTNEELITVNEEVANRNLELTRTNDDLNNLFSNTSLPMILLGKDLRIRRFTQAAQHSLHIISTDIGRPVTHLNLNIQVPDLESLILSAIETVSIKEREVQNRSSHWYNLRIQPYKTGENKIEGALLFFIDISSIKSAERLVQALEELKAARDYSKWIVDTVREPLLILDATLRVVTANPAFYTTFQVSNEQVENHSIYDLGAKQWDIPELRRLLEEVLPRNIEMNDFAVEENFPVIGIRVMLLNARRLDGQNLILLAIEDITARKRTEEQIQALNLALEQKVERGTNETAASNQELEVFCNAVAHDLRTPLRSIVSFSQILEKVWPTEIPPEATSYLQRISLAGQQMTRRIENLVEFSNVRQKAIKQEKVDLSATAYAIADALKKQQPERQVEFRIASGLTAQGDPDLIQILLDNLLDNAWKFTSKVPQAVIELDQSRDGHDTFFVRDNGAGFDEAYSGKLFNLFQRLHDEKDFPGVGMGLATVRRIVRRHGGIVWAKCEPGDGATFSFTLPKNPYS